MDEFNIMDLILNALIGIVLGYILYKGYLCPSTVRGPNSKDIINTVYNVDGKLYILEPVVCGCILK